MNNREQNIGCVETEFSDEYKVKCEKLGKVWSCKWYIKVEGMYSWKNLELY